MVNEKDSPSVTFVSNYKNDIYSAHVDFPDKDGELSVNFSIGAIRGENVTLGAYVYKRDKSVKYDPFREPYGEFVAKDEIPIGDYLDLESIRSKGIVAALKKAKFKGNDNSLNNLISDAQKATLNAWSEKNSKATSKLATLRKKIAHDIDETLGTKLEEKKLAKPLKKIEKVVSDKLFGKVKE